MPDNQTNRPDQIGKGMSNYAKYTGIAVQMIVIIGGMAYAGYKIDEVSQHKVQWVTAVMALAGVFISLYLVIRAVKN
ncbi:AtpZ/AtpI family protein [Mucilaginibacter sp. UR6-1]|uniref:AtpZ/AtpI family protein n=1 Tax=Mucilaginibacter sp. UR6-1 TaxID=1435643 RepID=UPI001E5677B9|nr:AtpZ/AtpI family protein [Mucilaginibacter sp. UR6-1]MCC8410816.1 AtpZ/AtpI family protein [Mucilaginibacter sp. UR6-1]